MAQRKIMAEFIVDENNLELMEKGSIENALLWCNDSGLLLVKYSEIPTTLTLPKTGDIENYLQDQYHLCGCNGVYIVDGDMEDLLGVSNISMTSLYRLKPWSYDEDGNVTGAEEGEALECVLLEQNGKFWTCNAYAFESGCGLEYALDFNHLKEEDIKFTWKDIVKVNDNIYAEEFSISGRKDGLYFQIDDFLSAVAIKYGVEVDDIETYMMDNISFNSSNLPFGAADCGCYMNGLSEWELEEYSIQLQNEIVHVFDKLADDFTEKDAFDELLQLNLDSHIVRQYMGNDIADRMQEYVENKENTTSPVTAKKNPYYAITTSMLFEKTVLVPTNTVENIDVAIGLVEQAVEIVEISLLDEDAKCETKPSAYANKGGIYQLTDEDAAYFQILCGEN